MIVTNKKDLQSIITFLDIKYDNKNTIIYEFKHEWPASGWQKHLDDWLTNQTFYKLRGIYSRKSKIIFNAYLEAPPQFLIDQIINNLDEDVLFIDCSACSLNNNHIASSQLFGVFEHDKSVIIPFHLREKHYICLNRKPRYSRIKFINLLLRNNLVSNGLVSFGSDKKTLPQHSKYKYFIDNKYQSLFPLEIDDASNLNCSNFNETHQNALINVVTETGFEIQTFNGIVDTYGWDRICITEKTIKAIWMKQLPLFVALKGHVNFLREKGIDVFDDFINHSYDLVVDPDERINVVFNELKRLCDIPISDIQNFCISNATRFDNNIQKCLYIAKMEKEILTQRVTDFLNY